MTEMQYAIIPGVIPSTELSKNYAENNLQVRLSLQHPDPSVQLTSNIDFLVSGHCSHGVR